MEKQIADLVDQFAAGKVSRRGLIGALSAMAAGASSRAAAHPTGGIDQTAPDARGGLLRTALCDLLAIDIPIIQASLGPWSTPELTASASRTGAIGSLGTVLYPPERVRAEIRRIRELTDRPFIVNFSRRPFNAENVAVALEERVPAISLAHGDPGDLPKRAHDAGARFLHMVHTVRQARQAAERGVDAIIAQGAEAGGFGGSVTSLCLVPQVVEAVHPVPVVAAGGIADGRGLAVALMLGAAGVNIGTRFVASVEAGVRQTWKERIVAAESEDTVRLTFADAIIPHFPDNYEDLAPRVLRTSFVDEWNPHPDRAAAEAPRLGPLVVTAAREGRADEYIPFTGQTAGLIRRIAPVAEIVQQMRDDAVELLESAPRLVDGRS